MIWNARMLCNLSENENSIFLQSSQMQRSGDKSSTNCHNKLYSARMNQGLKLPNVSKAVEWFGTWSSNEWVMTQTDFSARQLVNKSKWSSWKLMKYWQSVRICYFQLRSQRNCWLCHNQYINDKLRSIIPFRHIIYIKSQRRHCSTCKQSQSAVLNQHGETLKLQ